ncbi:MAG: hypothetical protein ACXVEF_18420 [Polyangiales bacterium]
MLEMFGIGLGKVEMSLERVVFVPGDRIRGRMSYRLKEPTPARRVAVGLYAKQRTISVGRGSNGGTSVGHSSSWVYRFELPLSGEDLYTSGAHDFELVIPSNALAGFGTSPPAGPLGDLVRTISFLSPTKHFPLEWEVRAFVDVPFKINPKTSQSITVTEYVR